ncbi:MAG: glycosyltransferase [Candidatus Rokubacteria bacterium]|nr:glycosyltransferase [Candidatus Rokubacteria bacterium]
MAAALARAGLKPRPGLVLTIHSRDPRRTIASHALAARVLRTTGGLLTTVSESERRRYLARGFPEDRCLTIHNGVPLPKPVTEDRRLRARAVLGRQCQERIVAHVGRLVPVKGHTVLLRALAGLRTRPDVLLVAGEGPLRGALEADCRRLGLEGTVVFLGFRDDIATVLYASDLLVLPSLSEVLPMAVLEAMAIGLPVVATRVGGIPELIEDGREGWLVDPDDPEALRVALEAALADPAARAARGSAARRRVEREFTSEAMVHATLAAYARAMERER